MGNTEGGVLAIFSKKVEDLSHLMARILRMGTAHPLIQLSAKRIQLDYPVVYTFALPTTLSLLYTLPSLHSERTRFWIICSQFFRLLIIALQYYDAYRDP